MTFSLSFASDNWAGASDRVMEALGEANEGQARSYGSDSWTGRANDLLSDFFERDVAAFLVSTGSAANSLALASFAKPGGVVICHEDAHIVRDEAGAPLLFSPGTGMDTVDGPRGCITTDALAKRFADYPAGVVHYGQPSVVSIANVNEIGQCYSVSDLLEIGALARRHGCSFHMDGARFMNALAHTGAAPADLTWRAGVDVLSFGLTKTGAWCAEVVVYFDPAKRAEIGYRHKQAAQLFSKNRFAAAQVVALLSDDHALDLARHANKMGAAIADLLRAHPEAELLYEPQSNEVFAYLSPAVRKRLDDARIIVAPWQSRSAHLPKPAAPDWALCRLVASFRTTPDDVARLAQAFGN